MLRSFPIGIVSFISTGKPLPVRKVLMVLSDHKIPFMMPYMLSVPARTGSVSVSIYSLTLACRSLGAYHLINVDWAGAVGTEPALYHSPTESAVTEGGGLSVA